MQGGCRAAVRPAAQRRKNACKLRADGYPATHVPTHKLAVKKLLLLFLSAILVVAGCHRPPATDSGMPENVPAPAAAGDRTKADSASEASTDLPLSAAVARILKAAERSGSVVEGCQCGPRGRMLEMHTVPRAVTEQAMEAALNGIRERHPQIRWSYAGRGLVRVADSSRKAGLLKVRVREFLVIEDRPPQASLPALWRTPEVAGYMRKHSVRMAYAPQASSKVTRTAPTVIQTKNASVAEILDRMAASYRTSGGRPLYHGWVYRECRSGAETTAEVAMF